MRTVNTHLLEEKMDEAVTHYINTHQSNEPVHIDSNGIPMTVQDDGGGRVTIMHQQTYTTQMCRQVSVTEQVGEGPWGEELLEVPIAAIVAHLQNSRHHPPLHQKVSQVRSDVDTSVILDGAMRFNGQSMEQQSESLVVQLPPMQTLPPLQDMKRCTESDWFTDKNKKDDECMVGGVELSSLSPAHHKQQSRKSLPHKKRISRKLKRNNGNCTPQQEQLVVINCSEAVPGPPEQEQILPDNYVTVPHAAHIPHEVRPVLICQECGEYYGEEQLKFYHHLKSHYEPQHTIIIENPVPDLPIDKISSNCIVDSVATLPDSIVELSLENTVPKTLYQPIDKHILYSSSDKTLSYNTNKIQYSMASMDGPAVSTSAVSSEGDKSDLYSSLDKLELFNCGKCSKTFRKQRHCEAHMREAHSNNTKIEDMGEFSEPEDLMSGISVCVTDGDGDPYEPSILPHLTIENGQVHQDHTRHWYGRGPGPAGGGTNGPCGGYCGACAREPDTPYKLLKEEVLQRIFDNEVSDNANFADNMIPDHGGDDHDHDQDDHNQHDQNEHSHRHNDHSHGHNGHSHERNDHIQGHTEQSHEQNNLNHGHDGHSHAHNEHSLEQNEHSHGYSEHSHGQEEQNQRHSEHSHGHNDNSDSHNEYIHRHSVNHGHNTLHMHVDSFRNTQNSQDHNEIENEQDHIENDHGHHEQILDHDNGHDRNENGNELSQDHSETSQDQYQIPKQEQDTEITKQKHFSCPKCERVFSHRNSLLYHLLSHEGKQHTCRDCGKGFYTHGALKIHCRQHSDDRPYKCETCGREFRQWSDLKYHNNSLHSDKKPFKCEYCGKQFARKYSLNLHVRIHTGEKNYKCDFCTKTFRCSSYKTSHMRTHTGDRPFKCEECQKSFRSAFDLRRHTLVHDKIRNRYEEHKPKIKETKTKMIDTKEEKVEKFEPSPKKMKQVALASTARPPVVTKKIQKAKKSSKKGAPNVTVQGKDGQFKSNDGSADDADDADDYDTRMNYCTVKHIYCESDKIPIIFKEEHNPRELAILKPIGMLRTENAEEKLPYRAENTDGKMQVFTQVEKAKDYNGSIVPNSQVLGDMRHVEREVARDGRSEVVGEGVMAESGFLERLTAMYNIPAV